MRGNRPPCPPAAWHAAQAPGDSIGPGFSGQPGWTSGSCQRSGNSGSPASAGRPRAVPGWTM
jgi:hypothetical protein